jgi:hypothetical protein
MGSSFDFARAFLARACFSLEGFDLKKGRDSFKISLSKTNS